MADAISPVWDQSGKYLYFLASTDYGLNTGWLDMSSYDPQITRSLYCLILSANTPSPSLIKSDEEEIKESNSNSVSKGEKEKKEEGESNDEIDITIDDSNLDQRIIALDLPSRNYVGLVSGQANNVFISEAVPNQSGLTIHQYDLEKMEASEYASGINQMVSSKNGEHALYRKSGNWGISKTNSKPNEESNISTSAKIRIDPRAEYAQIFREGWRYMRDFLYVDNQHGAPWDKIYEWYAPWIESVRHRTDLNYVVDIISGEIAFG
ncbi:MAG: protease, partial [Candidatus Kapaibacterium sp.]